MKFMPPEAYPSDSWETDKRLGGTEESLDAAVSLAIYFSGVIYP